MFADPVKFKDLANHEGKPWNKSKIGREWAQQGYYNAMHHPPSWHIKMIGDGHKPTPTAQRQKKREAGEIQLNNIVIEDDDFPTAMTNMYFFCMLITERRK